MRMHHGPDIRPHTVNRGVHGDLGSAVFAPLNLVALHIDDDHVVDMHHALAHAGGSGEDAVLIEADRDVSVIGGHPALLVHKPADVDDVLSILLFRFHHRN